MNLRQKLLLTIAALVMLVVAAVAWTVSLRTRRAFEQVEQQRSQALVAEVRREFQRQGEEIAATLDRMARSERVQRIAFESVHGGQRTGYVPEAAALAQEYHLDFLELVAADGVILLSAQSPARFGYHEQLSAQSSAFLQRQELRDGSALGMMSQRPVNVEGGALYLIGGRRLDAEFLRSLPLTEGMYVWFYGSGEPRLDAAQLLGSMNVPIENFAGVLPQALASGNETDAMVRISDARFDHADVHAVPMKEASGTVAAVLMVGVSRRPTLELMQHIRAIAYGVGGIGILLAILAGLWIAGRFSRPIEQLAAASHELAAGNWDVKVAPRSPATNWGSSPRPSTA